MTGGPDAALAILTTIAVSMVSLATLVLTITMVVVQLAMGQFSPRIVQTFLRDRPSQLSIGLFVATFAHAMIAMREVQFEGDGQVPGVAIAVSYVLVLTSIAMLVLYVDHIGRSLRVSALIELVGNDTRRLLDVHYPDRLAAEVGRSSTSSRHRSQGSSPASIATVSWSWRPMASASCTWCLHSVNSWPPVRRCMRIEGPTDTCGRRRRRGRAARRRWNGRSTRTSPTDSGCSSTWPNGRCRTRRSSIRPLRCKRSTDSTTVFGNLPCGRFPTVATSTTADSLRLTVPVMGWDAYVRLAFDEIRLAGRESPQVTRRLIAALDDLVEIAPDERKAVLLEQLDLINDGGQQLDRDERDTDFALRPDPQGIGVAVGATRSHAAR